MNKLKKLCAVMTAMAMLLSPAAQAQDCCPQQDCCSSYSDCCDACCMSAWLPIGALVVAGILIATTNRHHHHSSSSSSSHAHFGPTL